MPGRGTRQDLRNLEAMSPKPEPLNVVNANSCSPTWKVGVPPRARMTGIWVLRIAMAVFGGFVYDPVESLFWKAP